MLYNNNYINFLMFKRKRTAACVILVFIIGLFIYIKSKPSLSKEHSTPKPFTFNLINTPYARLKNGTCALQASGHWNCPDIRTQGPNKLRQSQLVMTRMLLVFDALAKKHNLRYWMTRGTLLGAARHKGFIPWDIDLDIEMPIEDYLRFLEEGVKELPLGTILQQHAKEREFLRLYHDVGLRLNKDQKRSLSNTLFPKNPRFRDEKSCYKYCIEFKCPWHDGLQIDIYPILVQDGYYNDQFDRSYVNKIRRFVGWLFGFNTYVYKAFPLKMLEFEGFDIPVPNQWKDVLRKTYGDNFMDLPPKEKQKLHDNTLPDPNHACSEFDESGNLKHPT